MPVPGSHFVQFYEEGRFLSETVAHYLAAGAAAGERLLLIAEPAHAQAILSALGPERALAALRSGQLTLVDARELLDSLLVDGQPDAGRFNAELERLLRAARAFPGGRVRAFGEMVNLLWRDGNFSAALQLEELWNAAGLVHDFSLLCAYDIGRFCEPRDGARFEQLCALHTHVIPTEGFSGLHDMTERLREITVLQQRARALESETRQRQAAEGALREMLESRSRVEAELRSSMDREREARAYLQAGEDFKQDIMGLLGRDLRQPLNTILTAARLMTLRGELTADHHRLVERVVSSGVRMQRMLEQALDMARDRWTGGISVSRTAPRDLRLLVAKIVEETRVAHPGLQLDLRADEQCLVSVDADRFEQVLTHLLSNAVSHGDTSRPVLVSLAQQGWYVSLRVQNYGPAIPPELLPSLFVPPRRARKVQLRSAGLGLGLYISERIVRAHGGALRAESSAEQGTTFEATFPRDVESEGNA